MDGLLSGYPLRARILLNTPVVRSPPSSIWHLESARTARPDPGSKLHPRARMSRAPRQAKGRRGYRERTVLGPDCELRQDREVPRNRRLAPGEEERLLQAAQRDLRALIIAALETCARRGELLSLQWREVDLERRRLRLLARRTKDGEERVIPISARLAAVLEYAKVGPAGTEPLPDDFVFGNAIGEQVRSVKTAWRATCQRAGIAGLRFHDLRHEAGSRLAEGGVPLHFVQAILGHSNLKQTSTYLNVPLGGLDQAMGKYDQQRMSCNFLAMSTATDHGPDVNAPSSPAGNPHVH